MIFHPRFTCRLVLLGASCTGQWLWHALNQKLRNELHSADLLLLLCTSISLDFVLEPAILSVSSAIRGRIGAGVCSFHVCTCFPSPLFPPQLVIQFLFFVFLGGYLNLCLSLRFACFALDCLLLIFFFWSVWKTEHFLCMGGCLINSIKIFNIPYSIFPSPLIESCDLTSANSLEETLRMEGEI